MTIYANFVTAQEPAKIKVTAVVRPGAEAGTVTITNTDNNESGTNELMVPAGNVNIKLEPVALNGYRFYTWGYDYSNPRYITWEGQTTDRAVYATFAKTLKENLNYTYKDNYEFQEYNNKQNDDALKDLTTNSTLVFFFDESSNNSGAFNDATFTMRKSSSDWNADEISGVTINKVSDQKLVVISFDTQDAVDYIKANGFKLRVSNMGEDKEIIHQYFGIGVK